MGRYEQGEHSKSSTGALDDTTGWRALETDWQCLGSLIHALETKYMQVFSLDTQVLEDCRYSAVTHANRHVRAAAIMDWSSGFVLLLLLVLVPQPP